MLSDCASYLYQVSRKYLKGFHNYSADVICILRFTKGYSSVKSVGGVRVFILRTLSDNALICSRFCQSISKGFRVTEH